MRIFLIGILISAGAALITWLLTKQRSGRNRPRRADVSKDTVPPIEIGDTLPTFNLIALGGQETGKTVLYDLVTARSSSFLRTDFLF